MEKNITPEVLEWLKGLADKAGEYAEREAPLLCQEIVNWYFWSSVGYLVVASVLFAGFLALAVLCTIWCIRDDDSENKTGWALVAVILYVVSLIVFAVGADQGILAAKAIIAPRVIVVQSIAGLLGEK